MSNVQVELAEELLSLADLQECEPSRAAAKLIALELFREGRVSLGRAAQLAGIGIEEFMTLSAGREVPLHYTLADWREDQIVAADLKP